MNFNAEQLISTQKNNVQTLSDLSQKAFAGFEKLVALNMAATKALMDESLTTLQAFSSARDPQALLALQSSLAQPISEKSASYSRYLYDIASGTSAELSKALEYATAETQKAAAAFVKSALKNTPASAEAAVILIETSAKAA